LLLAVARSAIGQGAPHPWDAEFTHNLSMNQYNFYSQQRNQTLARIRGVFFVAGCGILPGGEPAASKVASKLELSLARHFPDLWYENQIMKGLVLKATNEVAKSVSNHGCESWKSNPDDIATILRVALESAFY
jgi:hypothetical protein